MTREALLELSAWTKAELDRTVNFWLRHGMDPVNGGVYTCLDRKGEIFSTDKSVWMQGRCAFTFARLCNQYGKNEAWYEAAKSCLDFMEAHCVNRDKGGRMYFTVTGEGRPLRQRRYVFSEGFYAMANAEFYLLSGEEERLRCARDAYELIWNINRGLMEDPVGIPEKTIAETRGGRSLADPMIYLNLTSVLRRADPERAALYDERAATCVSDIFTFHRKKELGCTLEFVGLKGEFYSDITAGRVVNPGHDIECAWFLMEEANRLRDAALHREARELFTDAADLGWDHEYGGLRYFVDALGKPPEAYEHDMKLWWPHNELVIAALMAYRDTGEHVYWDWFTRTMDYCRQHFSDPEYGEWYGYLRRDGLPTQPPCKGSTFKGPFHLPRMLMMVDAMLDEIILKNRA